MVLESLMNVALCTQVSHPLSTSKLHTSYILKLHTSYILKLHTSYILKLKTCNSPVVQMLGLHIDDMADKMVELVSASDFWLRLWFISVL